MVKDVLTRALVDRSLRRRELKKGLDAYLEIQRRVHQTDVRTCRDFQRRFNAFYRVRRGADWQSTFYALLEESKTAALTFDAVLDRLYETRGRYEASFASKLVATLDPLQPVIDSRVLARLELRLPRRNHPERGRLIKELHATLGRTTKSLLRSQEGRYALSQFDRRFPKSGLTPVKKLDLILWQAR